MRPRLGVFGCSDPQSNSVWTEFKKISTNKQAFSPWTVQSYTGNTGYLGWLPGNTTGIKTKREAGSAEESSSGMVMYKGALVDMESVMQRLEKSEKTRTAVEVKLKDTQDEMGEWHRLNWLRAYTATFLFCSRHKDIIWYY